MLTKAVPPKIRIAAIALLVIVGGIAYVSARHATEVSNLVGALSRAQDDELGPDWRAVRRARSIAETVPDLERQLAAAKAAGTKTVMGVRVVSGETKFVDVCAGPGADAGAMPPLLVAGEAQGAITGEADGTLKQTWTMFATLHRGDKSERRQLDDVVGELSIDPAVEKAWKASLMPPAAAPRAHALFLGASIGDGGPGVAGGYQWGGKHLGGFAAADYILGAPARSRVSGGAVVRF